MSLRLDAPHKRAFALILAVGSGLLAIGIYKLYTESFPHRFFENWLGAISHKRYSYRNFWTAAWGTYLVVVGLLGSFLYDSTVGRLVGWVRNGREQPGKL